MHTTVELPDALVSAIKLRAAQEGRKLDDVVADMLRAGMTAPSTVDTVNGQVVPKCLPLIRVRRVQPPDMKTLSQQELCDWIKEQELQLEMERHEKAFGHQHLDRADS